MKGSTEKGLCYGRDAKSEDTIVGYVDSDYAGSIDTRKYSSGYVFTMYHTAISWKAKLQSVVALSTTKAEYM